MSQLHKSLDLSKEQASSNDNEPHGSWSVFEKGQSPSTDFQLMDGRCEFLRNSQLLHGELTKDHKYDLVKLMYSTHNVFLKGYRLRSIYELIMMDDVRSLRVNHERFINSVEDDEPFVSDIQIIWRSEED